MIVPQLCKIDDVDYFALGKKDLFNEKALIVSASFLKSVIRSDLYHILAVGDTPVSDSLQYEFDVGHGLHCYQLEYKDFDNRFYVSTSKNIQEKRTFIKSVDSKNNSFEFIKSCYENVKIKYPEILQESQFNEVACKFSINGVPCKCKIDKIIFHDDGIVEIIDLKSVYFDFYSKRFMRNSDGVLWKLIKEMKDLNYDLQGYFYYRAIKEYLDYHNYKYTDIVFSLLLESKDTFDVKKVSFSAEMMASGREKFNFVFPQVKSFYEYGMKVVDRSEFL